MAVVASPPKAWAILSQWLPPRNADLHCWWQLTGLDLAHFMEAAGYPIAKQIESLLFHYHWVVPYLGPAPAPNRTFNNKLKWNSILGAGPDGSTAIQYTWKWNSPAGTPDVGYTIDPIGRATGTALDPLNHQAALEMLHHIAELVPTVDLSLASHFLSTLYSQNHIHFDYASAEASVTTTVMVAAEWLAKGLNLSTYFILRPLGLGQADTSSKSKSKPPLALSTWEASLAKLHPSTPARDAITEFLTTNPEGKLLSPFMLAVTNTTPSQSHLKSYFHSPHTSFTSVRQILTLGGNNPLAEPLLRDLHSLITAITLLSPDFSEEAEIQRAAEPHQPQPQYPAATEPVLSGYIYSFVIVPGETTNIPEITLYIPVLGSEANDELITQALTAWLTARNRGQYTSRYRDMIARITPQRDLGNCKGVQTYVGCMFTKTGELDITSYIRPRLDAGMNPLFIHCKQRSSHLPSAHSNPPKNVIQEIKEPGIIR
ncbi:tryptophan dimethylallyltransferase-domain-containing protein [Aspergillus oleicola]